MLRTPAHSPPDQFKPKQFVELTSSVFAEVSGNASQQLAKYIVSLVGPFPPHSIIHDNACGKGVVSKEVMKVTTDQQSITIHATDLSEIMVEECKALAIAKRWTGLPKLMTSQVMAMQDLTFPDETFTHSIMNFAMFAMDPPDALKATKHVYWTL